MRLTSQQVRSLSHEVAAELEKKRLVRFNVPFEAVVEALVQAVISDLRVEDSLNEEVRDLLKAYAKEIEQGRLDYKTMFDMVKKKLVRERGLVL